MGTQHVTAKELSNVINRLAFEIIEKEKDFSSLAFIGLRSRGDIIARRVKEVIEKSENTQIPLGILDITLYRDDLDKKQQVPMVKETLIDFDIEAKKVILIDDVISTGRTIRAAMEALFAYGRPDLIRLLVLADRGGRELPIHPDYCGMNIDPPRGHFINIKISEDKKKDEIVIEKR